MYDENATIFTWNIEHAIPNGSFYMGQNNVTSSMRYREKGSAVDTNGEREMEKCLYSAAGPLKLTNEAICPVCD